MGFNIASILGDTIGKSVREIVGAFKLDPIAKAELDKQAMAMQDKIDQRAFELEKVVEDHITAEIAARKDIIVAEMSAGDKLTRWARPMIVYAGLFFIFMNHVLPNIIAYWGGRVFTPIGLPTDFWDAWKVVVSVWAVGRTSERIFGRSRVSSLVTGSKKP
jgi:hypothetical protein